MPPAGPDRGRERNRRLGWVVAEVARPPAEIGRCVRGRHQNGIDHMDHAIVGLNVGGGDLGKVQKQGVFLG